MKTRKYPSSYVIVSAERMSKMTYTMIADTDGNVYCTIPHAEGGEHIRLGRIEKKGIANFAVAFQLDALREYDKAKFVTYADAVQYEQGVLNEHMTDILGEIKDMFGAMQN